MIEKQQTEIDCGGRVLRHRGAELSRIFVDLHIFDGGFNFCFCRATGWSIGVEMSVFEMIKSSMS